VQSPLPQALSSDSSHAMTSERRHPTALDVNRTRAGNWPSRSLLHLVVRPKPVSHPTSLSLIILSVPMFGVLNRTG